MLTRWRKAWARRGLQDEAYGFLFEEPPPDEAVSLDCETTSLDVATAQILSIGAVRLKGDTILTSQRLDFLVRPTIPVPEATILIHHIRTADLDNATPVPEAMRRVLDFIGPRPLIGYFLEFDIAMLEKHLHPMFGTKLPNRRIEVSALYYDWRAARVPPGGNIDLRFETIRQNLDIPDRPAHDAFNDALMAAMMYQRLRGGWRPAPSSR
jgi:DNA polymerase-3 subunit epsilon